MHAIRIGMSGGVNHRNAGGPRSGEQLSGGFQRLPRVLAAGAGVASVDFADRAITALINLVVEVDRQHRGTAPDPDVTTIRVVDLDDLLIDDVLPAVILEIACHSHLLFQGYITREVMVERNIGPISLHAA